VPFEACVSVTRLRNHRKAKDLEDLRFREAKDVENSRSDDDVEDFRTAQDVENFIGCAVVTWAGRGRALQSFLSIFFV
jgi:hypothetical protein